MGKNMDSAKSSFLKLEDRSHNVNDHELLYLLDQPSPLGAWEQNLGFQYDSFMNQYVCWNHYNLGGSYLEFTKDLEDIRTDNFGCWDINNLKFEEEEMVVNNNVDTKPLISNSININVGRRNILECCHHDQAAVSWKSSSESSSSSSSSSYCFSPRRVIIRRKRCDNNNKSSGGGGGGGGVGAGTAAGGLELDEIQKYFDVPIVKAATELKVGLTVLKKRCRQLNIRRWPHRKIKSLNSLIHNVKELGLTNEIEMLEEHKKMMKELPELELTERTKSLRQAFFKANYKKRKALAASASSSAAQ